MNNLFNNSDDESSNPFSSNKNSTNRRNRRNRKRSRKLVEEKDNRITKKQKIECNNPLCDHKEGSIDNIEEDIMINDINDLINIGKKFHCKNRKEYHGINLRLLCNLVEPLKELQSLIGMKNVKENIVNQIVFFLQGFNKVEKCNDCQDCAFDLPCPKAGTQDMLHCVITGPPGVGKTRLGRIMGKIYKAMGVLSKGQMKIVSRSDLVGKYLGHTAAKTQDVIDECKGGVMFIDEAYSLGNKEGRDSFSKECLDTLNQNLTERRDFLCIIAGYKDALEECFFSYNEGLRRRFTFRYNIPGYNSEELMEIFRTMVNKNNWSIWLDNKEMNEDKKKEDIEWLEKFFRRNMSYFKNFGGDMETLFLNCKIYHGKRVLFLDKSEKKVLSKVDVENGFNTFISHRKIKKKVRRNPYGMRY